MSARDSRVTSRRRARRDLGPGASDHRSRGGRACAAGHAGATDAPSAHQADGIRGRSAPTRPHVPHGADVFGEGRLTVNDTGRKRNLALLLAAGMNWSSVLMLDDDMFAAVDGDGSPRRAHRPTLDSASLRSAVRATREGHLGVGWAAGGFDDNSVLCRIAGAMGAPQDQFIGAGALLVPISAQMPFFPSIYNEDWLFLLGLLRHRVPGARDLLHGGDVHPGRVSGVSREPRSCRGIGRHSRGGLDVTGPRQPSGRPALPGFLAACLGQAS